MKILITGSSGFIGSNLILHLSDKVDKLFGIDDFNDLVYPSKFKKFRSNYLKQIKNFKEYYFNISNTNKVEHILKKQKINIIIHLAAYPGVRLSNKYPNEYITNNVNNFLNIIGLAKKYNIKFIYASSSSIYNKTNNNLPYSEGETSYSPDSIYGLTKLLNENICQIYFTKYNFPSIGLRFFSIYGNLGRPDMALFSFMRSMHNKKKILLNNNGKSKRDYTSIKTVNEIIEKIIFSKKDILKNETYNIGNTKPVKTKHLLDKIIKLNNYSNLNIQNNLVLEQEITFANIKKIEKKFGKLKKYNIFDEIHQIYSWSIKNKYFNL